MFKILLKSVTISNQIETIVIFSLSGYLHKGKMPERVIIDIAQRLIEITGYSDENPEKVFQTIRDTCTKDPVSDQVNGYKRLHEALTFASPPDSKLGSVSNTILEIEYTLKGIGLFKSEASLWLSNPSFSSVLTPRDSSSFSHQGISQDVYFCHAHRLIP
jgi:hypothetical protein